MIGTQFKRGTAELAVLSVLEDGPLHGYEIGRRTEEQSVGKLRYTLAALYPLSYRMEKRGWLRGDWEIGDTGKRRRRYRLLLQGRKVLKPMRAEWADPRGRTPEAAPNQRLLTALRRFRRYLQPVGFSLQVNDGYTEQRSGAND